MRSVSFAGSLRFAANIGMLFQEHAFLERFPAAAEAGFEAVEFPRLYGASVSTVESAAALGANPIFTALKLTSSASGPTL